MEQELYVQFPTWRKRISGSPVEARWPGYHLKPVVRRSARGNHNVTLPCFSKSIRLICSARGGLEPPVLACWAWPPLPSMTCSPDAPDLWPQRPQHQHPWGIFWDQRVLLRSDLLLSYLSTLVEDLLIEGWTFPGPTGWWALHSFNAILKCKDSENNH